MTPLERYTANQALVLWIYKRLMLPVGCDREAVKQEMLVGLWRACQTFDEGRGVRFSTYATRCISRVGWTVADRVRLYADRFQGIGPPDEEMADTRPEPDIDRFELGAVLSDAISRLEPRAAQIIELRFIEGRKLSEIGDTLNISKERVRQLLPSALAALRKDEVLRSLTSGHDVPKCLPREQTT